MKKIKENNFFALGDLWQYFSPIRKVQFILLLILTVFTSFAEVLSLGALIPFLTAINNPEVLFADARLKPLFDILSISNSDDLLIPMAVIFSLAAIVAGVMRLLQAWLNVKVSFATGADLSLIVYRRTLYQPYAVHVSRNSSSIINAAYTKTERVIGSAIVPIVNIITSALIMISIMSALILINPIVAISSFVGFGFVYLIIILMTRKRLSENASSIARDSDLVVKSLQEGLGGYGI